MICPKDIKQIIKSDSKLSIRFKEIIETDSINISLNQLSEQKNNDFEKWLLDSSKYYNEIKRYVFYIKTMRFIFENIYSLFEHINPGRESKKDSQSHATSPDEMMLIAKYFYYLDSYGIKGDLLECGCFKGFSSSCLSWICDYFGRKLIIADSFEGLPDVGHSFYEPGDFRGDLETVRNNISTFGKINCVEFIKGWYSDTLPGFSRKIALLWMDVDLNASVTDVLSNVYHNIQPNGVIFSHEFDDKFISNGLINKGAGEVTDAIKDFFDKNNIAYKVKYLTGCTGIVVPNAKEGEILIFQGKKTLSKKILYRTLRKSGI